MSAALVLGAVEEFFLPSHLNGFQFAFIRHLGVVLELRQFGHVAMQVSEAHTEGIDAGVFFREQDSDVFSIIPGEFLWHAGSCEGFKVKVLNAKVAKNSRKEREELRSIATLKL